MVPGPHADRQTLVAVEAAVAENEGALFGEVGGARAQRRLHDHLDREPGGPVGAGHMPATRLFLEARIDLRRTVALPGPVPGNGLQVDAAHHRTRPRQLIRHSAGEIEGVVGDEGDVEVAVDGAEQRRIVLLALARIGAGLEMLMGDDAGAEFLRRMLERRRHRGVGRQRAFEHQEIAPFARHGELHEAVHQLGAARIDMNKLRRAQRAAQGVVRLGNIEDDRIAAADRCGERLEGVGRCIEHEEVRTGLERRAHRRRHVGRRFHRDAIEGKIHRQHAGKRRRLVDADFGAGQRMFAALEDDAFVSPERLVARIVFDLDKADLNLLSWRGRRGALGSGACDRASK